MKIFHGLRNFILNEQGLAHRDHCWNIVGKKLQGSCPVSFGLLPIAQLRSVHTKYVIYLRINGQRRISLVPSHLGPQLNDYFELALAVGVDFLNHARKSWSHHLDSVLHRRYLIPSQMAVPGCSLPIEVTPHGD